MNQWQGLAREPGDFLDDDTILDGVTIGPWRSVVMVNNTFHVQVYHARRESSTQTFAIVRILPGQSEPLQNNNTECIVLQMVDKDACCHSA